MVASDIRQQIVKHLQGLSGERVKALVLNWLTDSEGNLEAFERLLADQPVEAEETDVELTIGELNSTLHFQPLSDIEMVQKSREALEDYQRTGKGVTHDRVQAWATRLGTDNELPCPE